MVGEMKKWRIFGASSPTRSGEKNVRDRSGKNEASTINYPLVNIQKAIEHGHRNSEFSHEKWWIFP